MRRRELITLVCGAATALLVVARGNTTDAKLAIIDDLSREPPLSTVGTRWQLFTDQVMGGVSNGSMMREVVAGRPAICMRGDVSLENKGGFVQIAIDLMPEGKAKDASNWAGVELDVFGNGEEYNIHLRTDDLTQPWQSYARAFGLVHNGRRFSSAFKISHLTAPILPSMFVVCAASA